MHKLPKNTLALAGCVLASGLLMGSVAQAEGPDAAMLSNTCAGCHGPNGVSAGPAMPSIAGQPANYQFEILKQFRSDERHSTIMGRIAKGYTEEELKVIAKFYAEKKWQNSASAPQSTMATPVDATLASAGAGIQKKKKCANCHEDNGHSTEDDMPRMAGQWVDYLTIKMSDYKDAELKNPQPKKMAKAIAKLSADDINALAHFYASQQ
jgi:sulfide dehydrogenase cytochrome subunit